MNEKLRVLIVGAGQMAKEYVKVVTALNAAPIVVGRGEQSAAKLEGEMQGLQVVRGGIETYCKERHELPDYAIVAVDLQQLAVSAKILLESNIKNILIEKPAALNRKELEEIETLAKEREAYVYVAYNRRFYASVEAAERIIAEDGGVKSFCFEFTEWGHVIKNYDYSKEVLENWFLANSTHVADLAFYLGGFPEKMDCYVAGGLDWHSRASVYTGAGVSQKGALFSYHANWEAPGRWALEVLTAAHRLYFKPFEKLQIQEIGSLTVDYVDLDDHLDVQFKPGLYKQTESFLNDLPDDKKVSISAQLSHMEFYEKMEDVNEKAGHFINL